MAPMLEAIFLATSFPGFSPTCPKERAWERETLENAGHVALEQN